MQTIYTLSSRDTDLNQKDAQRILQNHFDLTRNLLVYLNYFLIEVCRYAETDSHQRSLKHLPTYEDLNVNTKITGNTIIWRMLEDESLRTAFEQIKPERFLNKDLIRKIYLTLTETNEYKIYCNKENRELKEEKNITEFVLDKLLLANEIFVSHIEENFSNWNDDGETVILLLLNFIQKNSKYDLNNLLSEDNITFAKNLLKSVIEKSAFLESTIVPKLKNWDSERIAIIDMILMKMGLSEFLYFETIPPKVTINEYIDLAKDYSTPQSGHFVNGILDSIHKELLLSGKIQKLEYKKK